MGLDLQVTPLVNGARVPSLYYDLPVSVNASNNSLKFLGGSGTNAAAFFHSCQHQQAGFDANGDWGW